MPRRYKWMTVFVVFTVFGLLTLNRRSAGTYNDPEDNEQAAGDILSAEALADFNNERKAAKAGVLKGRFKKSEVRLFAGTKFFGEPVTNERFLGHCSVKDRCKIVDDFSSSDAVVYHASDFVRMEQQLRPDQIAVLWFLESPMSEPAIGAYQERINWTMTYRRDADVPLPYGIFKKRTSPVTVDYEAIWNMKNSSAVWLVSNCNRRNGRIKLAQAIAAEGFNVTMYGACSGRRTPNDCDGVRKQSHSCVAELFRPFKFALSFENALCKDYITEKFFEVLQKRLAVPIVMQRRRYEQIGAPPNSFIAMDDFKNMEQLLKYLNEVEESKERYLQYHKWRESYTVESDYFSIEETGFCALCKKIMRGNFGSKNYESPHAWHASGTCEDPQDGFVNHFVYVSKKRS